LRKENKHQVIYLILTDKLDAIHAPEVNIKQNSRLLFTRKTS